MLSPARGSRRFQLVWDIEAQPDPRAVKCRLWIYEELTRPDLEAGPKWGKTTMIVDAVAIA